MHHSYVVDHRIQHNTKPVLAGSSELGTPALILIEYPSNLTVLEQRNCTVYAITKDGLRC